MKQSNKCGSLRNDEIINLHLGSGACPWISISCLLQDTSHICWFHPPKTINQEKTKKPEMRSNFQQVVSYCLGLRTQNLTLWEVDLEPSAKRRTNRTRALVSLYWSSRSLHLKQSPNQISNKSTKVDPIRSSQTCRKSNQIPRSYVFQHIKTIFPNTTGATHAHDWGYKWGHHTQKEDKVKPPCYLFKALYLLFNLTSLWLLSVVIVKQNFKSILFIVMTFGYQMLHLICSSFYMHR